MFGTMIIRLEFYIFTTFFFKNKSPSPTRQNNLEVFSEYDGTKKNSLLNEFLNSIEVNSSDEEDDLNDDINKAISEIDHYNPKPISLDKDVMMYWEEKKFVYPHLYELARIVHSVPATQVSVERSFSALKLVLTDLRCNLSAESLKKLLFVKLNK
ncbi:hypothetical protein CVS40_5158 [Lucilia cuprina]|nr:hypothetical protein CVS40_5158 [Lucilia cuprina]